MEIKNTDYITAEYCELAGETCGYRVNGLCRAEKCTTAEEGIKNDGT